MAYRKRFRSRGRHRSHGRGGSRTKVKKFYTVPRGGIRF